MRFIFNTLQFYNERLRVVLNIINHFSLSLIDAFTFCNYRAIQTKPKNPNETVPLFILVDHISFSDGGYI